MRKLIAELIGQLTGQLVGGRTNHRQRDRVEIVVAVVLVDYDIVVQLADLSEVLVLAILCFLLGK